MTTVYGSPAPEAAEMTEGPEIEGIISARSDDRLQVTAADGTHTIIAVDETTRIKASGGFLGLSRRKLGAESLPNGLPVSVETFQWDGRLVAPEIHLTNKDPKTSESLPSGNAHRLTAPPDAPAELTGLIGRHAPSHVNTTTAQTIK